MIKNKQELLLTVTEVAMLAYWIFATLVLFEVINVDPELMYSDYKNPVVVAWNWSFLPIDLLFALIGLATRFLPMKASLKNMLSTVGLTLMFCAGLMAVSFWAIQQSFDPVWWGVNLWLIVLSVAALSTTKG